METTTQEREHTLDDIPEQGHEHQGDQSSQNDAPAIHEADETNLGEQGFGVAPTPEVDRPFQAETDEERRNREKHTTEQAEKDQELADRLNAETERIRREQQQQNGGD